MILCRIRLRKVVIHSEAIQISSSLSHIIIANLHPVLAGVHVTEIPESLGMEILVTFSAGVVRHPAADIAAKREQDDIAWTNQRLHLCFPFIRIRAEVLH